MQEKLHIVSQMGTENLTSVKEFMLVGLTSHRGTQLLLFGVLLLIYLLILFDNLLIITLVWADSQLHTPMYFFLSNLAVMEIGLVTSTLPQMLAHLITGSGILSLTRCMLQGYIALNIGSAESLLLGVMAYDRYLAICSPLLYATAMSKFHQVLLVGTCWITGCAFSMIYVVSTFRHSFCGPNLINHFMCELPIVLKLACDDIKMTKAIVSGLSAFMVFIPLSVILSSYAFILHSILHMRSTAGRSKAFSTCGSHLTVVILFYGTVISMYIIPHPDSGPSHNKEMTICYLVITPLLNPVIYTLRNKEIHSAVIKMARRLGLEQ
ncbi:olfactory receptor 477-like [Thamnophis elegans]|uniref:olfactory receptor 477-like n=1 Tax=Thamnophis elegans TaxID=35005 RepID=UPI00137741F9|nr:olfactory receptor 477-like [Thamnophis elegans]